MTPRLAALSRALRDVLPPLASPAAAATSLRDVPECILTPGLLLWWRGVKVAANEVRQGNVVEGKDGRLLAVSKAEHTQGAGRQLGNVQLELRDVKSKVKVTARHRPSDPVELVRLEDKQFNCLYKEGKTVHLMDPDTYEQITVDEDLFGDQAAYIADGMDVTVSMHNGTPAVCATPLTVTLSIDHTDPHMKGESATRSFKPAVLSNGRTIMVPPFMEAGEQVVVNTLEGSFVRRASK